MTKIRGALIATIHRKTLYLPALQVADGLGVSLIANDVSRICSSLPEVLNLVGVPLELGVSLYLLEHQIAIASIAPVLVCATVSTISLWNSNSALVPQKNWLQAVQERIAYTSAMLRYPRSVKMMGLTKFFETQLQALRTLELEKCAGYRKFVTYRNTFSHTPVVIAPAVTLLMLVLIKGRSALDPSTAFTTLALVSLLGTPIGMAIHAIPMFQAALVSFQRIENLLASEDVNDTPETHEAVTMTTADGIELDCINPPSTQYTHSRSGSQVKLIDATVQERVTQKTILHGVNLKIPKGELTMIIGPVGCGKTTLCRTISGALQLSSGSRLGDCAESLALCSQEPWIPSGTLKEIIMAQTAYDEQWFHRVIAVCGLNFTTFSQGSETNIGTMGVSLSGGQKQLVALARALYARKKTLILDDTFGGLDPRSAQTVANNLFGSSGFCKSMGLTVIMATHDLTHLHHAAWIVALTADGRIAEQGVMGDLLLNASGYLKSLEINLVKGVGKKVVQDPADADLPETHYQDAEVSEDDGDEEEAIRSTGDLSLYTFYAKSLGWKLVSTFVAMEILSSAGAKLPDLWVRLWSEAEVRGSPTEPLALWTGIHFLIGVLSIVGMFASIWTLLVWAVPQSAAKIHHQLLAALLNSPFSFFSSTNSGSLLNRFANDLSLIETQLAASLLQTIGGALTSIISIIFIALGASYAGIAIPIVLLILYALQKFYLRTSRQLRILDLETQAPLITHIQETMAGGETLRAFGWQTYAHEKCLVLLERSQQPFYLLLCIQRWLLLSLDLITAVLATIVVALALQIPGSGTAGSVGLSLLNVLTFTFEISYLIVAWTTLETALGAIARCKQFKEATPSEHTGHEIRVLPVSWPTTGEVEISALYAAYSSSDDSVLHNINLVIPPGSKVGICGRSGSGKSSLLLAMHLMLHQSAGHIIIDGIDVSTIPRNDLRERMRSIPQDMMIIPGSVAQNLRLANDATHIELENALRKVGLWTLISSRGGLDVDMASSNFSRGELQLFAIARALLRPSRLVLVDEITTTVDAITEELIINLVRKEFENSTVIAVAHRLKTIVDFDIIVVMDAGRIVETGNPRMLLERDHGYFKQLWDRDNTS